MKRKLKINTQSKSILAKLLAEENISIETQNINTAKFDPINRVLTLPTFAQSVSKELNDMFIGHEVGHALFTPDYVPENFVDDNYRHYLNIVEDVRVDKKIQRKYPGLKHDYKRGKVDMLNVEASNFKLSKNDDSLTEVDMLKSMDKFIDRINIYFKAPHSIYKPSFTKEEKVFIDRLSSIETFTDSEILAKELFAYCQEQYTKEQEQDESGESESSDGDGDGDGDGSGSESSESSESNEGSSSAGGNGSGRDSGDYGESEGSGGSTAPMDSEDEYKDAPDEKSDGSDNSEDEKSDGSDNSEDEDEDKPEEQSDNNSSTGGKGKEDEKSALAPESTEYFDNKKQENIDRNTKSRTYAEIPSVHLENLIVTHKEVAKDFNKFFKQRSDLDVNLSFKKKRNRIVEKFKADNRGIINAFYKEFEMKKRAESYSKTKEAKTGMIDTVKMVHYKFREDIFKRNEVVPDSKNHGLVMFVDWSGSMSGVLRSVIEQVAILTLFCKKANIKFQVLAFSDSHSRRRTYDNNGKVIENPPNVKDIKSNVAYLQFDHYRLIEMFNSNMSTHEFNNALHNMMGLGIAMSSHKFNNEIPSKYYLGGTPLNPCIASAKDCIAQFKAVNRLEIVNTIFLTDGDSYGGYTVEKNKRSIHNYHDSNKNDLFLKTKNQEHLSLVGNRNMTHSLLKWVGQELDINVIGFFLVDYAYGSNTAELIKEGYTIEEDKHGYSRLYTIYTKNFNSTTSKIKSSKDYNTLVENLRSNQLNMKSQRNFVKNFIELIA